MITYALLTKRAGCIAENEITENTIFILSTSTFYSILFFFYFLNSISVVKPRENFDYLFDPCKHRTTQEALFKVTCHCQSHKSEQDTDFCHISLRNTTRELRFDCLTRTGQRPVPVIVVM